MATKAQIKAAVEALSNDDANWTTTGLPSVEAVSAALGERVTREEINGASDRMRDQGAAAGSEKSGGDPTEQRRMPGTDAGGVSELKAAQPNAADSDGPEPDEIWEAMEKLMQAASSPRWRRNQVLQQIRTLWANEQENAKAQQAKMEGRIERREAKREERAERDRA